MNDIIEKAKAHYVDLSIEVEVPEWETVIHATPLTLSERDRISKRAKGPLDLCAEILIAKAKDANGDAVFSRNDKMTLMKSVDASVVERIADAIFKHDTVEAAEKN